MAKWDSKLKLLLLIHLLLSDLAFGKAPFPQSNPNPSIATKTSQSAQVESQEVEDALSAAHELVSNLSTSLQGHLDLQSNASCAELANGGWRGSAFSQELLSLTMVPVLVSAGCLFEAQDLVMQLYADLGQNDTHDFLDDIVMLIKRGEKRESAHANGFQTIRKSQHHLQAVLFNINQLAGVDERAAVYNGKVWQCKRWLMVKASNLQGQATEQIKPLSLEEAKQACRRMGIQCAGLRRDSDSYRIILRPGSRIVPSSNSDSWIQDCKFGSVRWRRNGVPRHRCVNENEKRVYKVVEWIPAVSTLYNLGTAVYYASVNCYGTAKERAIFTTVDLSTDALMAMTGGTAGVAGYALGAGLKTGVKAGIKYMLNNMKEEEDLLMNQNSWVNGGLTD